MKVAMYDTSWGYEFLKVEKMSGETNQFKTSKIDQAVVPNTILKLDPMEGQAPPPKITPGLTNQAHVLSTFC